MNKFINGIIIGVMEGLGKGAVIVFSNKCKKEKEEFIQYFKQQTKEKQKELLKVLKEENSSC